LFPVVLVLTILQGLVALMTVSAAPQVVAWGDNGSGQSSVPPDLSNAVAVAAGNSHSLALRADGTVVLWGVYGSDGRSAATNVVAVAAGFAHSLALRSDGKVVAWGANAAGQTAVPADLTNAVAVVGGADYSLALRDDGTVVGWGQYYNGNNFVPVSVPAGL